MKTRSELNKLDVLRMLLLTLEIIFAALSFGIAAGTHFFRRAENLFGETFGGDLDRYQAGIYVTIALAAAGCALAALMLLWYVRPGVTHGIFTILNRQLLCTLSGT